MGVRLVFGVEFAGLDLGKRGFFSSASRFELLLFLNLLDDFSGVDFDFLEDVGLVGFGLDFDGLVDHFAEFAVALVELAIALHEGFVAGGVGSVLVFQFEDFAFQV